LTWHDQPFRKTHDLTELGQQAVRLDATLEDLCRRAAVLTAFSWVFRYPGGAESPTAEETQEGLALAREVVHAVRARLPEACHPTN
jgi:HEPN domain-containing protein